MTVYPAVRIYNLGDEAARYPSSIIDPEAWVEWTLYCYLEPDGSLYFLVLDDDETDSHQW